MVDFGSANGPGPEGVLTEYVINNEEYSLYGSAALAFAYSLTMTRGDVAKSACSALPVRHRGRELERERLRRRQPFKRAAVAGAALFLTAALFQAGPASATLLTYVTRSTWA